MKEVIIKVEDKGNHYGGMTVKELEHLRTELVCGGSGGLVLVPCREDDMVIEDAQSIHKHVEDCNIDFNFICNAVDECFDDEFWGKDGVRVEQISKHIYSAVDLDYTRHYCLVFIA